jgi:hypothetical protein
MPKRRCKKCGQFYSDSGLPRDYERREQYALALHCDFAICDAMPYWEADSETIAFKNYAVEDQRRRDAEWRRV